MTDALRDIYDNMRAMGAEPDNVAGPTVLSEKDNELWEKVKSVLGLRIVDELMNNQAEMSYQSEYEWFREGFRLGAALMLELAED